MDKIVGIHQPMFLPYTGIINKIMSSDCFIFLDDVQFEDGEYQHRNRIWTKDGIKWLTIPLQSPRYKKNLKEIKISNKNNWKETMLKNLQYTYGKMEKFKQGYQLMEDILSMDYTYLIDLNIASTKKIMNFFGIRKEITYSSDYKNKPEDRLERIVFLTKAEEGTIFLSGDGAKSYIEPAIFYESGIELKFQNYKCREYPQLWGNEFVPYMSIIDYIMYMGEDTSLL